MQQSIRFAAGSPAAVFSGIWRLVTQRDDVYLGASKASMRVLKISLHKSGVWTFAATTQSGMSFENGNRRAKRWTAPNPFAPGLVRGPSIVIPRTSLGSRPMPPDEPHGGVTWIPAPAMGQTAEIVMCFVDPGCALPIRQGETVLCDFLLANGRRVVLLASTRPSPSEFLRTVEGLLQRDKVPMQDLSGYIGGSFLWVTESGDDMKVPLIVDLPVSVMEKSNEARST